jgi:hypothetical protein
MMLCNNPCCVRESVCPYHEKNNQHITGAGIDMSRDTDRCEIAKARKRAVETDSRRYIAKYAKGVKRGGRE